MNALAQELIADVAAGILVLRERDGVDVTIGQAFERARNIVTGLMGNYEIRAIQDNQRSNEQGR